MDGKCDQCGRMIVLEEDKDKTKCGLCGGEAPRQPAINDDGSCEFCGRKIVLRE
jgi:DNA-directed RNA polymerase subunit RPC12/RpoP